MGRSPEKATAVAEAGAVAEAEDMGVVVYPARSRMPQA